MFIPVSTGSEIKRPPWGVIFLIAANIILFIFSISLGYKNAMLIQQVGTIPSRFFQAVNFPAAFPKEVLFLFLALFLHAGWLHLLGNLVFLWVFGTEMERYLGTWWLVIFYLVCGFLAQVSYIAFEPGAILPLIGASGAVSGLLGGILALNPRGKLRILFFWLYWKVFYVPVWVFLLLWVLLQAGALIFGSIFQGEQGSVPVVHLAGLIIGFLICLPLRKSLARRGVRA